VVEPVGVPTKSSELKPQQRPFQPFGAAKILWGCKEEEILMEGPAGTGKTRAILEKAHFCAMKYSGCRVLLVRKTRESMTESVLVTFEEKVVQEGHSILDGPQRNLRQAYHYPNGSEIVVGGMDKYTRIMSTEYDMICVFEATELAEEEFEALTTRLRNGIMPYQQIIADCNPGAPSHWLNKRPKTKGMTRLVSRHQDNPVYFNHELKQWTDFGEKYRKKLSRLSGTRRLRLFEGKWAAAEGMIYPEWDEQVHILDKFVIPASWRRIVVVDFGFRNPFVAGWWAIDEDKRMYLYRQIYLSERIVEDHARYMKHLSEGEKIDAYICDHDAEDRATLERHLGVFTKGATKDITPGIEAVQARLRKAGDDRPRLFIIRGCLVEKDVARDDAGLPTKTEDEWDSYVWKKEKDGKAKKEEPDDNQEDHGMDMTRYAVAEVDDLKAMMIQITGDHAAPVF
jgi:PBSX family phage terminase large subunit